MSMKSRNEKSLGKGSPKRFGGSLAITVMLLFCSVATASADNTLTCYKGDKDNMIYVGEISEADLQEAADECNSFYGDCNGECFGCYLDEEMTGEICVDNQGNKFTP